MNTEGDLLHVVTRDDLSDRRRLFGRALVWGSTGLLIAVALAQGLHSAGKLEFGTSDIKKSLTRAGIISVGSPFRIRFLVLYMEL